MTEPTEGTGAMDEARNAWATARGFDMLAPHWDDLDPVLQESVRRIVRNLTYQANAALRSTAPAPPFPEGSYEHPLERRLEAAAQDFLGHPRLGLSPSDKHAIPLTSTEARQLLALLRSTDAERRGTE